jgi:2-aminophenol/2-amino-5-chlorophenol 1,6-dioxygenase beta subunit
MGYERLRASLSAPSKAFDVILVHTPHWRTTRGTHVLAHPRFQGLSVDPVFPHLFRYTYDVRVDVELASALVDEARAGGLEAMPMRNPDFRVDYGTLVSCHMTRPKWDVPVVAISSNTSHDDYSVEVGDARMIALGEATRRAVERTGRRALLLASCSLSHRHFTREPVVPEDMTHEHVYNYNQYLWDVRMLGLLRSGRTRRLVDEAPDFVEQATSETKAGSLTWLLAAMGFPEAPCTVHAYGTVIGTGNAVVEVPAP